MAGSWRYTYSGLGFCREAPTEWEHGEEMRVSTGSDDSDHCECKKEERSPRF